MKLDGCKDLSTDYSPLLRTWNYHIIHRVIKPVLHNKPTVWERFRDTGGETKLACTYRNQKPINKETEKFLIDIKGENMEEGR